MYLDFKKGEPISLDQLVFKVPFSEDSADSRFPNRRVFFTGVVKKPGIIVSKYVDILGMLHCKIGSSSKCMYNAALSTYEWIKNERGTEISFAFIPAFLRDHGWLIQGLRRHQEQIALDENFKKLQPWVLGHETGIPPLELFDFRPVWYIAGVQKRWSFLQYGRRSGVYIFRKKFGEEKKVVHVGKSMRRLSEVLRNHFYRNPHVNYYLDVDQDIYDVAVIEVTPAMCKKPSYLYATVANLENTLKTFYLNGADQYQDLEEAPF